MVVAAAAAVMLYPLVTQPSLQKLRSFFSELQSSLTKALGLVAVKILDYTVVLSLSVDLDHVSVVLH